MTFEPILVKGKEPRDTLLGFTKDVVQVSDIHIYQVSMGMSNKFAKRTINNLGAEVAVWIDIPASIAYSKVKSVGFYFPNIGSPKTPFRIKFYSINSKTGLPDEFINTKNLIFDSRKSDEWYDIDLFSLDIYPEHPGFFVSMEWLGNEKRKYWSKKDLRKSNSISEETKSMKKQPLFGQVLGMYHNTQSTLYSRNNFNDWSRSDITRKPMIRVQLSIAE